MADDGVTRNLKSMHELDFDAWNGADWAGRFTDLHAEDVLVEATGSRRRTASPSISPP